MNKNLAIKGFIILLMLLLLPYNVLAEEINEEDIDTTESQYEEHKVAVIITKVDENEEPLEGATLQILDSNNAIVDEWVSDGTKHEVMLLEGEYVLHEKEAPKGYNLAEDISFVVEAVINEINAGTDHDTEICDHYKGIPLYYVESQGVKQEVYCINQGWDEPHDINYDGAVVTIDNITTFTPDYDKTMTSQELYDKVLDIVYHRSKASQDFPDLSEIEIRYITEYALKNYTSTDVETQNGKDKDGNPIMIKFLRYYSYDANENSRYIVTPGEGDAIGNLAKHWWTYHRDENKKRVAMPDKYAELYYYLVRDEDHHPSDMHLYVYSTNTPTSDGDNYQNLLGVTWFNPYDDTHKVEIEMKDEYSTEVTSATVLKVWNDGENQDGIRPNSIEVTLSNGTTVTLSESNGWTATIDNLPMYEKGEEIVYTWTEGIIYGYELTSNETNGYITTLTNKHNPETTEIFIKKIWDDYDDVAKFRPSEISVDLLANGNFYRNIIIKNTDNWEITISELPKKANGNDIVYSIIEHKIIEYDTKYERTENGFNIINHHELGKGNGNIDLPPKTGVYVKDTANIFIILLGISITLFTTIVIKKIIKED